MAAEAPQQVIVTLDHIWPVSYHTCSCNDGTRPYYVGSSIQNGTYILTPNPYYNDPVIHAWDCSLPASAVKSAAGPEEDGKPSCVTFLDNQEVPGQTWYMWSNHVSGAKIILLEYSNSPHFYLSVVGTGPYGDVTYFSQNYDASYGYLSKDGIPNIYVIDNQYNPCLDIEGKWVTGYGGTASVREMSFYSELKTRWKIGDINEILLPDLSDNGYDGNIINATGVYDPIRGPCLSFNGTNSYVSIANEPNLNITGDITISAWVYLEKGGDGSDGSNQVFVAKTVSNGHLNNPFDFRTEGVIPILTLVRADASGHEAVYSDTPISIQQWHHVLVRVENKVPDFYLDGVVTGKSITAFTKTPTGNTNPLYIGRRDSGLYLKGRIDDVRIYTKALSPEEIQSLYSEVMSYRATSPSPDDQKTNVDVNVVLSWSPGEDSVLHDVYFGTDFNDVNNGSANVYMGYQEGNEWPTGNQYPNGFDFNTTYYWRIDEYDIPDSVNKGVVWSFKTMTDTNLVGWWRLEDSIGSTALDSSGHDRNGSISGATWFNDPIRDWCLSFDGSDDYVSVPSNDALNITGDITISAWVYFESGGTELDGSEQVIVAKTVNNGAYDNPFDFRTNASVEPRLTLIRADANGHEVVYSDAPMSIHQWHHVLVKVENNVPNFYVDGNVTGKTAESFTKTPTGNTNPVLISRRDDGLYFNGVIDDVQIYNIALSAEKIQQLYQNGQSYKASNPNPANGVTSVEQNVVLSWSPGKNTISHDVYFGTAFNQVNDASRNGSGAYMGNQDVNYWDTNNYSTDLDFNTTYYWRIDEYDSQSLITKGAVWSFQVKSGNPIGLWTLNEGAGTIAGDSSGNGYNGTIYGATWFDDPNRWWCLNFDGSNDYVRVASNTALNITGDITISAWVYLERGGNGLDGSNQVFVAKTVSNGAYNNPFDFRTEGVTPILTLIRADASGHEVVYSDTPISIQQWHHVLVRVENKVPDFYLDGVVTGKSITAFTKTPTGNTNPLYIGRRDNGLYMAGRIQDVRIYQRALSVNEIQQLSGL
jgi:hypothetical protein